MTVRALGENPGVPPGYGPRYHGIFDGMLSSGICWYRASLFVAEKWVEMSSTWKAGIAEAGQTVVYTISLSVNVISRSVLFSRGVELPWKLGDHRVRGQKLGGLPGRGWALVAVFEILGPPSPSLDRVKLETWCVNGVVTTNCHQRERGPRYLTHLKKLRDPSLSFGRLKAET